MRCSPLARLLLSVLVIAFGNSPFSAFAQESGFSDLIEGSPAFEAAKYLQSQGIITGYSDGTFKPDNLVNRAEAIKIIIAPLLKKEALDAITSTPFQDIRSEDWYLPYVETARQTGIVDGPPKKAVFQGTQPVRKMEFIKMLLLAYRVDPNSYSEILLPLSSDTTDTSAWYYSYLRYSITASMTSISKDGTFDPGRQITREDAALLTYRFLMYRANRRSQALLSETENEIILVLGNLENKNIEQAEFASARALLAARGALASASDQRIVQGALKTAEAFRSLVRGYRAGSNGQLNEAIRLAGEAWNLGARAKELDPSLSTLSEQVQELAKKMADGARSATSSASSK